MIRLAARGLVALALLAPCSLQPAAARPALPPLLLRHQVDWFGERLLDAWPGIGDRSIGVAQVGDLVARIKDAVGQARGRPLSGPADRWSIRNDIELQELLDRRPRALRGFPGKVWAPLELPALRDAIEAALTRYAQLTGDRPDGVTPTLLVAWIMKESSANPYASPYASSSARSTATGLLQITRTTYDDLVRRGRFPAQAIQAGHLPARWDEPALCDPVTNLLAALFVLREKRRGGKSVEEGLRRYYGSGEAAAEARYARGVLAGEAYLRQELGGTEVPADIGRSAREVSALLAETGRRVRRP